jgi:GTP-binding protein
MFFLVNSGPFAGQEGKAVSLRQIKERLDRELRVNVALRVEDLGRADGVKVSGRGELHLAILIEEMRREGIEMCVSKPEVITKRDEHGNVLEPMEQLIIDAPVEYQGVIIAKLAKRKGELAGAHNAGTGILRMEFTIPTRGLIGYRSEFLTDTRGLGIMSSRIVGYGAWCGEVVSRTRGSMISMETGESTTYSLENLQLRGTLFVGPSEKVYEGMIVGEHARPADLPCKPTKSKVASNVRSAIKAMNAGLDVPHRHTLESALEWISDDELVEATPKSVRVRKTILSADGRKRAERKMNALLNE